MLKRRSPSKSGCLHCHETYDSYLIEWRIETDEKGEKHGFWCCPTENCDGRGFGFDILPTDPNYHDERGGWVWTDDEDEEEYDDLPADEPPSNGNGHNGAKRVDPKDDEELPW